MGKDFTELVTYLDGKFAKNEADHRAMKGRIDTMLNGLDRYAKRADTYFDEMVMLRGSVNRHESWIHRLAEKIGIKLRY